ncbi:uncharacterized protein BDZ99DRAFT_478236 [Mytilinidion resinicola]|uniref:Uncharacterized protein n=1 Tax=Mytilinidion resinicola TaxID=574789 RepID=A0A6A6YFT7_9PEZI|nr:uncharacterized protein BDZ99DRAFT_478236 [Mytilinidion resinicola]KAF2807686.1 hypothetical protein BDZ99DRAFT_478236 [Mytilinidion resinicola]
MAPLQEYLTNKLCRRCWASHSQSRLPQLSKRRTLLGACIPPSHKRHSGDAMRWDRRRHSRRSVCDSAWGCTYQQRSSGAAALEVPSRVRNAVVSPAEGSAKSLQLAADELDAQSNGNCTPASATRQEGRCRGYIMYIRIVAGFPIWKHGRTASGDGGPNFTRPLIAAAVLSDPSPRARHSPTADGRNTGTWVKCHAAEANPQVAQRASLEHPAVDDESVKRRRSDGALAHGSRLIIAPVSAGLGSADM